MNILPLKYTIFNKHFRFLETQSLYSTLTLYRCFYKKSWDKFPCPTSLYKQYIISSLTISSALARMLFILRTQSICSCTFNSSVTPSRFAICSTSKSNLSSACSCIINRCFFYSPDNNIPE